METAPTHAQGYAEVPPLLKSTFRCKTWDGTQFPVTTSAYESGINYSFTKTDTGSIGHNNYIHYPG